MANPERIGMENINSPGRVVQVDAAKYTAMRGALMAVLGAATASLTYAEIKERLLPLLPADLFPGGAKAGWWLKGLQLDLEAKGLITRQPTTPLRWRKA